MNNCRILPFAPPIMPTFPIPAHLFAMFSYDEEQSWLLTYLLMLSFNPSDGTIDYDICRCNRYVFLKNCPLLNTHGLERAYINKNYDTITDFIISTIDNGYYLYLLADTGSISAYESMSTDHDLMIFGYDKEKQVFHIADFFNLNYVSATCSFTQMENAYQNVGYDYYNGVVLLKKTRVYPTQHNIDMIKTILSAYVNSRSTIPLINNDLNLLQDTSNFRHGLAIYNAFVNRLREHNTHEQYTLRNICVLCEHKHNIAKLVSLLNNCGLIHNYESLVQKSTELTTKLLMLRNIYIKQSVKDQIDVCILTKHLLAVRDIEEQFLLQLLESIKLTDISLAATSSTRHPIARFTTDDYATKGSWVNRYGTLGYYVVGYQASCPKGTSFRIRNANFYLWEDEKNEADSRALQAPSSNEKSRGVLFSYAEITIEVMVSSLTGLSLYFFDYETNRRKMIVEIIDMNNQKVVCTKNIDNLNSGVYITAELEGHFTIKIRSANDSDAVLSGLFFDPVFYECL